MNEAFNGVSLKLGRLNSRFDSLSDAYSRPKNTFSTVNIELKRMNSIFSRMNLAFVRPNFVHSRMNSIFGQVNLKHSRVNFEQIRPFSARRPSHLGRDRSDSTCGGASACQASPRQPRTAAILPDALIFPSLLAVVPPPLWGGIEGGGIL